MLAELCSGLSDAELPAALSGLLAATPLVRAATLAALPAQPSLEGGECPAEEEIVAVLWLARHDPATSAPLASIVMTSFKTAACSLCLETQKCWIMALDMGEFILHGNRWMDYVW